ncbi:ABC transporter permease subunit [Bacillaceae bacterium S4-13-58]
MVRAPLFKNKTFLTVLVIGVFIWSLTSVTWNSDLFHSGGGVMLLQILKGMVTPDFSSEILSLAIVSTWKTLAYAVAGMSLAVLFGFVFGLLASGVLSGNKTRIYTKVGFRGVLGFMRAIHELVWAWLFVAAIGLSPYTAIFAISIPYGGILGRIFADMLNDVPQEPIDALRASGASRFQVLLYGYLPIASADMVSYVMYRFECAIRSSAIMSFVGLGGLGYQIQLSLDDLKYDEVWTFLYFLIAIVVLVDLWSQGLRKRLVS